MRLRLRTEKVAAVTKITVAMNRIPEGGLREKCLEVCFRELKYKTLSY